MFLFFNYAVDFDTSVGANECARCTSDTFVGVDGECKVVAAVVHFFGLEHEYVGRTGNHAEVASFAAFSIYFYSSLYFCHTKNICFGRKNGF